ncbi:MAG: LTA synthase family protein [Niabella sp.]|nr:LTA synthase family protein [Niabella sp.]
MTPTTTTKKQTGFWAKSKDSCVAFVPGFLVLAGLFLIMRLFELTYDAILHHGNEFFFSVLLTGIVKDLSFLLGTGFLLYVIFWVGYLIRPKLASVVFIIAGTLLCIIQLGLIQYFQVSFNLLGGDLWGYKIADIKQTVGAAGVSIWVIIVLLLALVGIALALKKLPVRIRLSKTVSYLLVILLILMVPLKPSLKASRLRLNNEYANNLSVNKLYYFYTGSMEHFYPEPILLDIYSAAYSGDYDNAPGTAALTKFSYVDEGQYPFLHKDETPNVLSPFFNKGATPPNIVIIIVEGFGRAFVNSGASLGNYTPFLDSLSHASLYWENCLSTSGRTFSVLPSLLGSLPFGRRGFAELGDSMPQHLSLLSLLKHNGYSTSFYYGGDAHFDNMDLFMHKSNIGNIYDIKSFPPGYVKLPAGSSGVTWGYGDKELFRWYLNSRPQQQAAPQASVLLTVATHSPFIVNDEDLYLKRFEQRLTELHLSDDELQKARTFAKQYASVLYTDDALRGFFKAYAQRPDYANTIFMITGDHQMPELPLGSKIDRYHVPFIIYSPLLSRSAKFSAIASHFDVTPSILTLLKNNYQLATPSLVSWIGAGLDTSRAFRNIHSYPMMQDKNDLIDFVQGKNMINNNTLFDIDSRLRLSADDSRELLNRLSGAFDRFKEKNLQILNGAKLVPDSIYTFYSPGK